MRSRAGKFAVGKTSSAFPPIPLLRRGISQSSRLSASRESSAKSRRHQFVILNGVKVRDYTAPAALVDELVRDLFKIRSCKVGMNPPRQARGRLVEDAKCACTRAVSQAILDGPVSVPQCDFLERLTKPGLAPERSQNHFGKRPPRVPVPVLLVPLSRCFAPRTKRIVECRLKMGCSVCDRVFATQQEFGGCCLRKEAGSIFHIQARSASEWATRCWQPTRGRIELVEDHDLMATRVELAEECLHHPFRLRSKQRLWAACQCRHDKLWSGIKKGTLSSRR